MEAIQLQSAQGLVIAPKAVLEEAQSVFTQIGASVEATSLETARMDGEVWRTQLAKSWIFLVFYVTHPLPKPQFAEILRGIKQFRNTHFLCYVPRQQVDLAFTLGKVVGQELGETAEIASNVREAKQLLKSWDAMVSEPPLKHTGRDLLDARKRLGLTQEQMASALNVTTRTLQNWERDLGTTQMERKTRDLWELLELMDDYVVTREEKSWLGSPNAAFKNKKPIELMSEGKLRDLIIEFQRLREGQPL